MVGISVLFIQSNKLYFLYNFINKWGQVVGELCSWGDKTQNNLRTLPYVIDNVQKKKKKSCSKLNKQSCAEFCSVVSVLSFPMKFVLRRRRNENHGILESFLQRGRCNCVYGNSMAQNWLDCIKSLFSKWKPAGGWSGAHRRTQHCVDP